MFFEDKNNFAQTMGRGLSGGGFLVLLAVWLFATYWNFGKAYHIDDTAYLEIARWITGNPWHPMSGLLSWGKDFEPIHDTNQPHLYFYVMAAWAQLFGWSEASMHALMSLFTLWAIFEFYWLAKIVVPHSALFSTALFALSPAFVVGQNSMVDIPLLAVWLGFFRVLVAPELTDSQRYSRSAVLCSIGLLIKYTSLVLIPALLFHMLLRRRIKQIYWLISVIFVLVAWSLFNIADYGGVHLLGRKAEPRALSTYFDLALTWILALGAITPFAIYVFAAMFANAASLISRLFWFFILMVCCLSPLLIFVSFITPLTNDFINTVLKWSYFGSGIGLALIIQLKIGPKLVHRTLSDTEWILIYWLIASAIFNIALAPFMAARHVLLAVPPLLLLLAWIDTSRIRQTGAAVIIISIMITSLLAAADYWYADIYRRHATLIRESLPKQAEVWFTGHWGWQWYAAQAGMQQLSAANDRPKLGDFIVSPEHVNVSQIPKSLELVSYQIIAVQREHWIQRFASINFYYSSQYDLPISYSDKPIERFIIWKVVGIANN